MSKNSKQYRAEGYATIFRHGHVYLIRRDAPTHARVHPVNSGRWMDCPIADMGWISLADLAAWVRDDIRAALAACYCDSFCGLCDFCSNVRQPALPGAEGVQSTENPTPTFTAEFSLTPEAGIRAAIQKGLF